MTQFYDSLTLSIETSRRLNGRELEIRLSDVDPALFYSAFAALAPASTGARYEGTRSYSTAADGRRHRVDCDETSLQALACSIKERVGTPSDHATRLGRLRIDLAIERPTRPSPPAVDAIVRHKQRVSFRLIAAPAWRVDFTRVDTAGRARTHEIEIELVDDAPTADLVRQALVVLDALSARPHPIEE